MNRIIICSASVFVLLGGAVLAERPHLHAGDSMEHVEGVLGEPRGKMTSGKTVIWSYDQGVVEFEGGKVIEWKLVSKEAAVEKEADRLRRDADRQKRLEAEKEIAERRREQGQPEEVADRNDAQITIARRGDTEGRVKELFAEPDLIQSKGNDIVWCYDKRPVSYLSMRIVFQGGKVATSALTDWRRQYPHLFQPRGRFRAPFVREKSGTAKYLGAIPIEFETSKAAGYSGVKMMEVKQNDSQRYFLKLISGELAKHPVALREGTIQYIYAAWYLKKSSADLSKRFFAMGYLGGAAGARTMCLSKQTPVQHEFGHMLQFSFRPLFPNYKWQGLFEAKNARYGSAKSEFVSPYGKTRPEEDFAEMMELLFMSPESLYRAAEDSPVLQQKLDVVLEFYADVVEKTSGNRPALDLAYFRRLERRALRY